MIQGLFRVAYNRPIARDTWEMRLLGDPSRMRKPGQFVNVKVGNAYLRRPLSVADWDADSMTLLYKVVGQGTAWLTGCAQGTELDLLVGLGNGFDLAPAGPRPLLVGGGVGLPPLYRLGRELIAQGAAPQLIMGFGSAQDVFYRQQFEALMPVQVMTMDGSLGGKGLVTDAAIPPDVSYLYACGPVPMLKALHALPLPAQFSLEERMACGFGACMGCTVRTVHGPQRVCKEGPVFFKEALSW